VRRSAQEWSWYSCWACVHAESRHCTACPQGYPSGPKEEDYEGTADVVKIPAEADSTLVQNNFLDTGATWVLDTSVGVA
jgi:hypothetical protein